jgi:ADP-ribose pyrophosphatase YjhB (NUDIX family)
MGLLDGWRTCPRCAAALERSPGRATCPSCGSVYYANSAPAAEALLERDGRVLLARRAFEPRRGYWDLPGGFLEEGEEPLDGLRREVREELGIDVEPVALIGTHVEPYDEHYVLGLTWLVHGDGEPVAADDVSELAWVGPDELPAEMAFAHQEALLRAWAAGSLGGSGRKNGPIGS